MHEPIDIDGSFRSSSTWTSLVVLELHGRHLAIDNTSNSSPSGLFPTGGLVVCMLGKINTNFANIGIGREFSGTDRKGVHRGMQGAVQSETRQQEVK